MKANIYHILGSDIPHHNHTVLQFFQTDIVPHLAQPQQFWVVSREPLAEKYRELNLRLFASKKEIAKAVVQQAKTESSARFVLHGQFNFPIWFAILFGSLPAERLYWHIWGADLYEDSRSLKFRLFYPLRRLAQKRLKTVLGTYGDLAAFSKINAKSDRLPIYFPTKMNPDLHNDGLRESAQPLTILLGNSGDPSNRHLSALAQIKAAFGEQVSVIVPMGYPENNQAYIAQVQQKAAELFPNGQVSVLDKRIDFADYLQILHRCDLGYFIFERQQGIGTICLLIQHNIPIVLHSLNPFALDLEKSGVPYLLCDSVSRDKVAEVQRSLMAMDKTQIAFFYPNYTQQWLDLLGKIASNVAH